MARRLRDGVEAADVRHHDGGIDEPRCGEAVRLDEVLVVAARRAHDVRRVVVAVVEVDRRAEILVGGAGEEIHAAVIGEHLVAERADGRHRCVDEDVIVAVPVREVDEPLPRVVHLRRVHVEELDAVFLRLALREHLAGTCNLLFINICDDDALRMIVADKAVGRRPEAHGAAAAHDDDVAAALQPHLVVVVRLLRVVHRVERADRAGERLPERRLVEAVARKRHERADLHRLVREDAILCVAAEELVGIARRVHAALVVECGLLREAHARLELILPFLADLHDDACELMPRDDGMRVDVLRAALVLLALLSELVRRHAKAVAVDLREDLVVLDLRQLELLEAEIEGTIHSDCSRFHNFTSFFMSCKELLSYLKSAYTSSTSILRILATSASLLHVVAIFDRVSRCSSPTEAMPMTRLTVWPSPQSTPSG